MIYGAVISEPKYANNATWGWLKTIEEEKRADRSVEVKE